MSAPAKTTSRKRNSAALVAVEAIASRILVQRAQRTILDADLATLYGVTTKRLNEQVRRNAGRFPADFMFQISRGEWESLRSQIATLETGRGQHRKYLPYAFTEHGAIMTATSLEETRPSASCTMTSPWLRPILGSGPKWLPLRSLKNVPVTIQYLPG